MKYIGNLIATLLFVSASAAYADGVDIDDAWVREAPPGMQMLAGYMVIENETGNDLVLTGASSSAFGAIELHKTSIKDGMASMEQQESVTIPAHSKFVFKPKSYHLMLMKPKRDLREGDSVKITLQFSNYKKVSESFAVRKAGDGMMHHHHEHDMHQHE